MGQVELAVREKTPRQVAYEQAVDDLDHPSCKFEELVRLYPNRVFHYGEDGYGLKISGKIIFYTYGSGRGIMMTENELTVNERGYPTNYGNWHYFLPYNQLPKEHAEAITKFARETKEKCQAMREDARQRAATLPSPRSRFASITTG